MVREESNSHLPDGVNYWRDLSPLLRPQSVAVVGASQQPSQGNRVIRNLQSFGFSGPIFPINPKYNQILGLPCYPDLAVVPKPVDCLVVVIPARHINGLLRSAVKVGVRAAIVLSSGFGEADLEGKRRQEELETICKEHNLFVCGPNCYGLFNVFYKAPLLSSRIQQGFPSGNVGLISQSGGLSMGIANALVQDHAVGLSYIVSCGNQAGVTVEEYLNYLLEDSRTEVIAAFVEGFKEPAKLLGVARKALLQKKPIIVLKVGNSEASRRAVAAHSGVLAGKAAVLDAAFRQAGIVQVSNLNEMIKTIALFSCRSLVERFRGGRRIGILTGSGGECSLVADICDQLRLKVPDLTAATKSRVREALPDFGTPQNPLDGTSAIYDNEDRFPLLLRALASDPNLDMIGVRIKVNDMSSGPPKPKNKRFAQEIAAVASESRKPMIAFSSISGGGIDREILLTLREAGVPFFEGMELAMTAVSHLVAYAKLHYEPREDAHEPGDTGCEELVCPNSSGLHRILSSEASFRLLESVGIPVVQGARVNTMTEAVQAAKRVGYPVVLKVDSPSIQHKTDVGGVVLQINGPSMLRRAFSRIRKNVTQHASQAEAAGMLVQPMAPAGLEMLLGIKQDPTFGPVVVCGFGGIFVEVLRDISIGIPPLSQEQARILLLRLQGWPILEGIRGHAPADIEGLCDAIVKLSCLALAQKETIIALDINPLIVYPKGKGVLAVDVLIQVQ